jgi:hypothetical protein
MLLDILISEVHGSFSTSKPWKFGDFFSPLHHGSMWIILALLVMEVNGCLLVMKVDVFSSYIQESTLKNWSWKHLYVFSPTLSMKNMYVL